MDETIANLQARLRSSLEPVSAFYLLDSQAAIDRMLGKVAALGSFGVSTQQLVTLRATAVDWLRGCGSIGQLNLDFQVDGEVRPGFVKFANLPSWGVEVELILPGLVAATAPEFLVEGFWCAFMPPSFYD
jgi:hypothetical protein